MLKAEINGVLGVVVIVLLPGETLFLRSRDDFAVDVLGVAVGLLASRWLPFRQLRPIDR